MLSSGRSVNGGLGRLDRCLSSPTRHGGVDDLHDDNDYDDDNLINMMMTMIMMMMRRIFSDSSRHSDSYSSEAEAVRLGKDEKLAREAGITFDVKVIISLCWQSSFDKD